MVEEQTLGPAEDTAQQNLQPPLSSKVFQNSPFQPWSIITNHESFAIVFSNTSIAERELAEKAAKALISLRSLNAELQDWHWPNSFASPKPTQLYTSSPASSAVFHHPVKDGFPHKTLIFWGCLPASLVLSYLDRLEKVRSELESIDYENLKNSVLSYRAQALGNLANIRPTDSNDLAALTSVLVLHLLALHARLDSLVAVWTARLLVLQMVPDFFGVAGIAEAAMLHAWTIVDGSRSEGAELSQSQEVSAPHRRQRILGNTYERLRDEVEEKIAKLGQKIDSMLDLLADHETTIPDAWVDLVEDLEIDYSNWTVEAQKKLLRQELQLDFSSSYGRNVSRRNLFTGVNPLNSLHSAKRVSMPGAWQRDDEDEVEEENSYLESDVTALGGMKAGSIAQQWALSSMPDSNIMKSPASMDFFDIQGRSRSQSSASPSEEFIWPQVC